MIIVTRVDYVCIAVCLQLLHWQLITISDHVFYDARNINDNENTCDQGNVICIKLVFLCNGVAYVTFHNVLVKTLLH